ncbi:MAG: hypothetical protein ACWA5W_08080 [Phycisphaerales bacterium]
MPEKNENNPDYARGLSVCSKPGIEFVGAGSAGMAIGLLGTQAFASLFIVPVISFFVLRNWIGTAPWLAGVIAGVITAVVVFVGIILLMQINKTNRKQGSFFANESDSRYRVRVVIPARRSNSRLQRWAQLATEGGLGDVEMVSEDELMMIRGGFEPIIVHPWFGLKRTKTYWWTVAALSIVLGAIILYALTFLLGGWGGLLRSVGFMGYALSGLMLFGGALIAETLWPAYIRLVPGQLDIFRFGFLGLGEPEVESFDLHKVGICVDFGGYLVALEPERPVGEPLPSLVQSKRWPHAQTFPDGFKPVYFAVSLLPSRRLFAQRLIQAARTNEPTPPVSMTRLGE